jgi:5-methylcytosine-specific restriction endonuclease McrA
MSDLHLEYPKMGYWRGKKRPPFSDEWKRKISETHKAIGVGSWMKGRKHSEERKKKIREACKGEKSYHWKGGYKNKLSLNRQRRALLKGAEGTFSLSEWEDLKKRHNWICLLCGRKEPDITLTVDHIIPLSKGGSNYISNIQPLCRHCNSVKGVKILNISANVSL